ncbi:MAG: hypothetical protein Q7K03_10975 [Dehalococcoidia bacterium]|nr:hypothetical protein [Dehalococcoidia bacterium]
MSLQAEMHSLVGQISSARETRRSSLSSMRQGVGGQLHQLHQSRQRMARDLRSNLSRIRPSLHQGEQQRSAGVQRQMGEIAHSRAEGQAVWRTFIGTRHGEKIGGPAPSTAQPQEGAAPGGHRAKSRGK